MAQRICKEQHIDALISLSDLELPILAENKKRFEEIGVRVIVSDPQVIDICFDKYKTAQGVESLGLKAPKTYVRLEDVKQALTARERRLLCIGAESSLWRGLPVLLRGRGESPISYYQVAEG